MDSADPFNATVKELKELLVTGRIVQQSVSQKGIVNNDAVKELQDICASAKDMVDLLRETLQVIESHGGRVHGKVFTANEIMERQSALRLLQQDTQELEAFYETVRSRSLAVQSSRFAVPNENAGATTGPSMPDEFVMGQQHAQREEMTQQDEALDRLAYGLQELRETGVNIQGELGVQDELLTEMDRDVSTLQVRLRSANEKVDKLLASMSNKGKICTILGLLLVLIFLFFFVLG